MAMIEVVVLDNEVQVLKQVGKDIYSQQLVMTKEAFIECYEKWVKPIEQKDEVEE